MSLLLMKLKNDNMITKAGKNLKKKSNKNENSLNVGVEAEVVRDELGVVDTVATAAAILASRVCSCCDVC